MILQFTPKHPAPQREDSASPAPAEQAPEGSTPFFEGQFLYEIYADEVATKRPMGFNPVKWKQLNPTAQAVWQTAAERFTAAL